MVGVPRSPAQMKTTVRTNADGTPDPDGYTVVCPETGRWAVLVDGVTEPAWAIDTDAGVAHCHKVGPDGKFVVDPLKNEILTEIRHGKVELVCATCLSPKCPRVTSEDAMCTGPAP